MKNEVNIKPGKDTSEHAVEKSNSVWGIISTILGLVITFGGAVGEALGADTKYAVIVGAVIAVAGTIQKTLVSLGYIKSRTDVKKEAEKVGSK